jgi:NAD(P)-dependent dehydrogenase (short-subunit alcohol dehydrogenase family)
MRRTSVVTGATEGIGRAVAHALATRGDRVFLVGRHEIHGAQAVSGLPGEGHAFLRADLSLLGDTARLVDEILGRTDRVDALVCSAGILTTLPRWTDEGMERAFVLNYLSRYLLVRRLLPLLTAAESGRLVLVANPGIYKDTLDFDDLQYRRGKPGLEVSARTQFANDLLATELAERLRGTRVEATAVWPGVTRTNVFRNAEGLPLPLRALAPIAMAVLGHPVDVAADTIVHLASAPEAIGAGGRFFGPKRRERKIPARALHADRRVGLWKASEVLVSPYL